MEAMKKVMAVLCICGLMGLTAGLPLSRVVAEEKTETQNGKENDYSKKKRNNFFHLWLSS